MKKIIFIILIGFVVAMPACFEDDSSSGGGFNASIVINITNSSTNTGIFLAAVYDFPDIDVTNSDISQMEGFGYIEDSTATGGTITINNIKEETVYLAVVFDESEPLLMINTGEYYFLYNGKAVGSPGDPITLTDGGTEIINIEFNTDALLYNP